MYDVIENTIRNEWFKGHEATVNEVDGMTVINFNKPKDSTYAITYIFKDNMVFISGDVGSAVYRLTWKAQLGTFSDLNIGYFTEKLECSSREKFEYTQKCIDDAVREIREQFLEGENAELEKDREALNNLLHELRHLEDVNEFFVNKAAWEAAGTNIGERQFDSDDAQDYVNQSRQYSYSICSYLIGLKMIEEQVLSNRMAV
ncbi:hypothetical protein HB825_03545 [Listeria booriae]|uniref:hypothetical protein n=1 Tax=Listeria booriae TaxID=1552123 RepID=UPI00164E11A8|nr:hypothetical protein [Listeria booriae]MBC6133905.1 hypothetical protein [Listeria booriae]